MKGKAKETTTAATTNNGRRTKRARRETQEYPFATIERSGRLSVSK